MILVNENAGVGHLLWMKS